MPDLVMENIIRFLNFRTVLTLRQVCRDFRNIIDRLNDSKLPDSKFTAIGVLVEKDNRLIFKYRYYSWHQFIYSECENSRNSYGKTTLLGNSNIADVAIRDLEFVLKSQKYTLKRLDLIDRQLSNDSSFSNFTVKLSNMLTQLNRKIKIKFLSIRSDTQSGIMSIIPFADPKTLKVIDLHSVDNTVGIEIDEIVKTEQWKKAETIYCNFCALGIRVEDIYHFSSVWIELLHISARDLDLLRKNALSSSTFKDFQLEPQNFNEKEELCNIWGPAFSSRSSNYWYFRMENSEEKILRVEIRREYNHIRLKKIQMRFVRAGATIHDYNEN